MTSLRSYLLNNALHLNVHTGGLSGWFGGKQILKGLLYLLSLAKVWIGMGGSCGFCGPVFIVYALYLSLINAALMSAVTDTTEQRPGLTQCADDFLPTFKASERSKTLPPACLFELKQEDRCSRKTHTKPKTVNLGSRYSSNAHIFWKPSSCFQHALWSKRKFRDVFSSITIVTHVFPRWGLGIHMQISHEGHCKVSLTSLYAATSIQPISVIGLLFANDLLSDKWCVTNSKIMQPVFPEKWNLSYTVRRWMNMLCGIKGD